MGNNILPKTKVYYIVKHIIKKLSKKEQRELVSFIESYKYRNLLDNNKSKYLFLFSNAYTKLVSKEIIIENTGILEDCWANFIAVCRKKVDFKRHIAYIAYKYEDEELKSTVDKIKKFDDLYNWIYDNKPAILKQYIEMLTGTKEYSTYCINPKLKEYIWKIYRQINKNEREKWIHLRDKYPQTLYNILEEIERMFPQFFIV